MSYTWEKVSETDLESIFRGMAPFDDGDLHLEKDFRYSLVRAIDRAAHSFLVFGWNDMGDRGDDALFFEVRYEFFWRGKWYKVGMNDGILKAYSGEPVSDEERKQFRKDLRAAVTEFGEYGQGPADTFISDPMFQDYAWGKISEADLESISRDMTLIENGMPHLEENFRHPSSCVWALDRAAHSFVVFGMVDDMGEGVYALYEFFWRGQWYTVELDIDEILTVRSGEPVSDEERKEFRHDLRAALLAFGEKGQGTEDDSFFLLDATFKEAGA